MSKLLLAIFAFSVLGQPSVMAAPNQDPAAALPQDYQDLYHTASNTIRSLKYSLSVKVEICSSLISPKIDEAKYYHNVPLVTKYSALLQECQNVASVNNNQSLPAVISSLEQVKKISLSTGSIASSSAAGIELGVGSRVAAGLNQKNSQDTVGDTAIVGQSTNSIERGEIEKMQFAWARGCNKLYSEIQALETFNNKASALAVTKPFGTLEDPNSIYKQECNPRKEFHLMNLLVSMAVKKAASGAALAATTTDAAGKAQSFGSAVAPDSASQTTDNATVNELQAKYDACYAAKGLVQECISLGQAVSQAQSDAAANGIEGAVANDAAAASAQNSVSSASTSSVENSGRSPASEAWRAKLMGGSAATVADAPATSTAETSRTNLLGNGATANESDQAAAARRAAIRQKLGLPPN